MREDFLWLWAFCQAKGLLSAMGILPRERITFGVHSSRGSAGKEVRAAAREITIGERSSRGSFRGR